MQYPPSLSPGLSFRQTPFNFISSTSTSSTSDLIIIKDLITVHQDRINTPDLPTSILNVRPSISAHKCWSKYNRQVRSIHPICRGVLYYTMKMEGDGAQCSIVGIWKGVDDGMERIATGCVIVVFWNGGQYADNILRMVREETGAWSRETTY